MLPKPVADLSANTAEYETTPLVNPAGFREYDARWRFPEQLNLMGAQALGMGLGTLLHELGVRPALVVGHDYRSYSLSIKQSLTVGLLAAGCEVHDIGLALSPTAYFAQFALDVPGVAMVTASHNPNGWTGVKMGAHRPLTFGPDEMSRLKEIVMGGTFQTQDDGSYTFHPGMAEQYMGDLTSKHQLKHPLKVVVACGNGTAGFFAPKVLEGIGCEVIPLHCALDHTFPHYNPNPEDLTMLHDMADKVRTTGADVGLAFDGDGDRCGIVDNNGDEIFADHMGVILARDLSQKFPNATFVADVKSTGLYLTDPVLKENGATTDYWKTGHSYIKRRANELGALVGFEKSGHYFFNEPLGRGYDDGIVSAIHICALLDQSDGKTLADLRGDLQDIWSSPTMSPHCPDDKKYAVVEQVKEHYLDLHHRGQKLLGQSIKDIVTVNGVRVVVEDGTWGLLRASSNVPGLVVVVESPKSEARMREMFGEIDGQLKGFPDVGDYDQSL